MGEEAGGCSLCIKIYLACDLMLKKKLLLLVTELVAILNYLGVIHL